MLVKLDEFTSKNLKSVCMENYVIKIINQTSLPENFEIKTYNDHMSTAYAIKTNIANGPGTLKTIGAFALAQATHEAYLIPGLNTDFINYHRWVRDAADYIKFQKSTEKSLTNSVNYLFSQIQNLSPLDTVKESLNIAQQNAKNDEKACKDIGKHGLKIIEKLSKEKRKKINILTDSCGGWLSFVNHGSSHSPIYEAKSQGIDVKVYIEQNNLYNKDIALTSWELQNSNIEYEIISNNNLNSLIKNNLIDLILKNSNKDFNLEEKTTTIPFYLVTPTYNLNKKIENKNLTGIITENGILKVNQQ